MTNQIGGFRPQPRPGLPATPSGRILTDTSDYYLALGRRLRSQAMRDMAVRIIDALSPKPHDRGTRPSEADRFLDEALAPTGDRASKNA